MADTGWHGRPLALPAQAWALALRDTPLLLAGLSDLAGRVVDVNAVCVEGAGYRRDQVLGRPVWEGPWWGGDAATRALVRRLCEDAARDGALARVTAPWWPAGGSERFVDLVVHPVAGDRGAGSRLFFTGLDVTDRVRAEQVATSATLAASTALQETADERADNIEALRSAQERLAQSTRLSQHVLDNVADGIYGLARDMTGIFANRAAGTMLGYRPDDLLGRDLHALLHRGPDGSAAAPAECAAHRALASGQPCRNDREMFRRADGSLLPVEVVAVPTLHEGTATAVVVSFRDLTERLAAEEQAQQLQQLQASEALQRSLSDQLQQALLTAPPRLQGLQVAVRYRAAAAQARVGGDWYDAFVQPDGSTVLVVGDVVGHDSSAAGAMGQLRGLLRGVAYGSTDSPAAVLGRVESAARGLGLHALATGVLARVAPGGGEVTWSSAGHLPPAVLDPDGRVRFLRTPADLLLGIDPSTARRDHVATLERGASLLLFTDGLVERRGEDIDDNLDSLAAALSDLGGSDPERVCEVLLERLLPPADGSRTGTDPAGEDDVALLVLRRD